ncbi:MAG TPA: UbiX family flavin prenyltransferase [Candidatus Thermoplasmatota archaeon]|nr:UbiX family flavin prenyltransferase [Candidatus Thermoplasmatota archaeon]
MSPPRIIVAITGGSGAPYAVRLLEVLPEKPDLIISDAGRQVIEFETGLKASQVEALARRVFDNRDLAAAPASGSHKFDALVIVPCSTTTLSKIAVGIGDNLVTRAAQVCLKERRKLVIVPRETPLSAIHLEQMAKLSALGVTVLMAAPPWYIRPKTLDDFRNYMAGKILDHIGVEHNLFPRWKQEEERPGD